MWEVDMEASSGLALKLLTIVQKHALKVLA